MEVCKKTGKPCPLKVLCTALGNGTLGDLEGGWYIDGPSQPSEKVSAAFAEMATKLVDEGDCQGPDSYIHDEMDGDDHDHWEAHSCTSEFVDDIGLMGQGIGIMVTHEHIDLSHVPCDHTDTLEA